MFSRISRRRALLSLPTLIILILTAAIVPTLALSTDSLIGDVNGDSTITALDALAILAASAGKELPAAYTVHPYGDANGDGTISAVDAQVVLGYIVGKDVSHFPVGHFASRVGVTAVEVTAPSGSVLPGATVQMTAVAKDTAGDTISVAAFHWSTSDSTIATVDARGLVLARAPGFAEVYAEAGTVRGHAGVMVGATGGGYSAVALGSFGCGIGSADAKLYCWGNASVPHLPSAAPVQVSDETIPVLASLDVGQGFACAVTTNGAGQCWGPFGPELGDSGFVGGVKGGITWSSISAGGQHACGLDRNGKAYCWGSNTYGQLGILLFYKSSNVPASTHSDSSFSAISAGNEHTCGVTTGGTAMCWGYNGSGELGTGTTTGGTVLGGHTFTTIGAGNSHTCALASGGEAYCWGDNSVGELGAGAASGATSNVPVPVAGGLTFAALSVGDAHACALTANGEAYCWGDNRFGELGNGDGGNGKFSNQPVKVLGGNNFTAISAGSDVSCGRTVAGSTYCWGEVGSVSNATTIAYTPVPILPPGAQAPVNEIYFRIPTALGMTVKCVDSVTDAAGHRLFDRPFTLTISDSTILLPWTDDKGQSWLTAIRAGTGTVSVEAGGIVRTQTRTYSPPADTGFLAVNVAPQDSPFRIGRATPFQASVTGTIYGAGGSVSQYVAVPVSVTWSSSDSSVATVVPDPLRGRNHALVTFLKSDTVTISASVAGLTHGYTILPSQIKGEPDLTIDAMYATQAVQWYNGSVPLLAGRDGVVRVFAKSTITNDVVTLPRVRIRGYLDDALVFEQDAVNPKVGSQIAEGSINLSFNAHIPADIVQPGLTLTAEVDPDHEITETDEGNNLFPAAGRLALEIHRVPPLRIRFVPVRESVNGFTGNVSENNKDQFLNFVRRALPVAAVDADVRATPYVTDAPILQSDDADSAWQTVLREVDALRVAEGSDRHYFGIVKLSYTSGLVGLGQIPGKAAIGWDADRDGSTVAHELGHNFGRYHAPCGGADNPDPSFPNSTGAIEAWGLDVLSFEGMPDSTTSGTPSAMVKPPSSTDLMGYCAQKWISPYTFEGILSYRLNEEQGTLADVAAPAPALLVWGSVSPDQMVLEPAYEITTRPSIPQATGPYHIEGIDANGAVLFSYAFAGTPTADGPGRARSFAFAIPLPAGTRDRLATLRLTGNGRRMVHTSQLSTGPQAPGLYARRVAAATPRMEAAANGRTRIRWDSSVFPGALIRDAATGEILSFARHGDVQIDARGRALDVIFSDGVRSEVRRIAIQR